MTDVSLSASMEDIVLHTREARIAQERNVVGGPFLIEQSNIYPPTKCQPLNDVEEDLLKLTPLTYLSLDLSKHCHLHLKWLVQDNTWYSIQFPLDMCKCEHSRYSTIPTPTSVAEGTLALVW